MENLGELRGRWWNGTYGRLARLDIWLYQDGQIWRVRGRKWGEDGPEVVHTFTEPGAESQARLMVDRMIERSSGGKEAGET